MHDIFTFRAVPATGEMGFDFLQDGFQEPFRRWGDLNSDLSFGYVPTAFLTI